MSVRSEWSGQYFDVRSTIRSNNKNKEMKNGQACVHKSGERKGVGEKENEILARGLVKKGLLILGIDGSLFLFAFVSSLINQEGCTCF